MHANYSARAVHILAENVYFMQLSPRKHRIPAPRHIGTVKLRRRDQPREIIVAERIVVTLHGGYLAVKIATTFL